MSTCRGCGCPDARLVVDLGDQPACDDFPPVGAPGPDQRWPLHLYWCPRCALVQLGPVQPLPQEPVRAVESDTSRRHARAVAQALAAEHPWLAGATVCEFASHHGGSWLPALGELGCVPAPDAGPARLVTDTHALAHESDVGRALAERAAALAPDGLLVVEHHHLLPLVLQGQFDTIRHGHFSYLSLTALRLLGRRHGLEAVSVTQEPVFGGSLRTALAPAGSRPVDGSVPALLERERAAGLHDGSGLVAFGAQARRSAAALRAFLVEQRAGGRRVLGYGAPSKAAVLLGLAGATTALLEFTVDAAPLKHGLAVPGVRVPIRPVRDLLAARPSVVLVLTWDIAGEVIAQLESAGSWGARYVLPLPVPHEVQPDDEPAGAVR